MSEILKWVIDDQCVVKITICCEEKDLREALNNQQEKRKKFSE